MKHALVFYFTALFWFIIWMALRRMAPEAKWELSPWGKRVEWCFWTVALFQIGCFIYSAARRSRHCFYIASLLMSITLIVFVILRIGMMRFAVARSSALSVFTKLMSVINSWPILCGICFILFCIAWLSRHRPIASICASGLSIFVFGLLALRIQFNFSLLY